MASVVEVINKVVVVEITTDDAGAAGYATAAALHAEVVARESMLVDGKLAPDLLPSLAIGETYVVNSEAAMLALNVQKGDLAKRTDIDGGTPFILASPDPTQVANWIRLTGDYALSSDLTAEVQRAQSAESYGIANTTSAVFNHEQNDVHAQPQPPIIGSGPNQAVPGNDARLTDKRVSPDNSVTPAQLTAAVQALFDAAGSADAVHTLLNTLSASTPRIFTSVGPVTSTYAATAWQIVQIDTTGGAFTLPLPAGSSLNLGDTIGFKLRAISGTNYPTITTAGVDTINGSLTSAQLKLVDELVTFVWVGSGWLVGPGHKSLGSLDGRYAPIDSVPTVYQSYVSGLVVTNSNLAALAAESGYVWAVVDSTGHIAMGIKPDGTLYAPKYNVTGISVSQLASDVLARLPAGNVGSQLQYMPDEQTQYPFAIVDSNGKIAFAIDTAGHVQAITTISDGAITLAKLAAPVQTVLPQTFGTESGYAWAVVDSAGRTALAITNDGTLFAPKFSLPNGSVNYSKLDASITSLLPQTLSTESGYAFAVVDQDGRVSFGVDPTGKLIAPGISSTDRSSTVAENPNYLIEPFVDGAGRYQLRSHHRADGQVTVLTTSGNNFDAKLTADDYVIYRSDRTGVTKQVFRAALGGSEYGVIPSLADGIGFWGDSLTQGAGGGGVTTANVVAGLLGVPTSNQGIGGQGSQSIAARQNGQPALLTVTSNQIPASGAVAVTALSTTLLTGAGGGAMSATGTLAGVPGTLAFDGTNYTFTRTTPGATVACPAGTPFITDIGVSYQDHVQILWLGRNTLTNPAQVASDTAACVAYLKNLQKRFLVLSVLNGAGETTGTTNYNYIKTINDGFAATYGGRYLDIRSYLVQHGLADAGITPTTQDTSDIAGDTVPTSLRADNIHLLGVGYTVVGTQIANKITSLGWS